MTEIKMQLVWKNCELDPPEKDNDNLFMADGTRFFRAKYSKNNETGEGEWQDAKTSVKIPEEFLEKYWWTDIEDKLSHDLRFFPNDKTAQPEEAAEKKEEGYILLERTGDCATCWVEYCGECLATGKLVGEHVDYGGVPSWCPIVAI